MACMIIVCIHAFIQLSGGESFEDVCPLVDLLPTGNYTQPVNEERDIQLVTRNLPAPVSLCMCFTPCTMLVKQHLYAFLD